MTGLVKPRFSLAYLTVQGTAPRRMIEIAAATGFDFVSLRLAHVTDDEPRFPFTTDPALVADTIAALGEHDLSVLDVELVKTDQPARHWDAFVEVSAELGARHVIVQVPEPDRARAVEQFHEVCELAAVHGLTVDLEFIPWSATRDLAIAADIVATAGQPNGAVLVDTLHFARSGSSLDQLAGLPREFFNFAQVCDARTPKTHTDEELIRVARFDREPPGEADIDLQPIVAALPTVPYSLEVPNEVRLHQLGPLAYSKMVLQAAQRFFDTIRSEPEVRPL